MTREDIIKVVNEIDNIINEGHGDMEKTEVIEILCDRLLLLGDGNPGDGAHCDETEKTAA